MFYIHGKKLYYIGATRAEAILFYFILCAESELTFWCGGNKRIGIGERVLPAQTFKKHFLSNYKFNLVRTPI